MFWRKQTAAPAPATTSAPSEAALERLHEQAANRRYDLRVCNPAHGGFYALMARYKDAATDPAALEELATEIEERQACLAQESGLRESFGQLAELARWRARKVRALAEHDNAHPGH
ncbi:MAG: hypothetical protein HXY39_16685 [Chloroflexi bacterium]|nr:hypothetical protein [Chloroflexota bacterium]